MSLKTPIDMNVDHVQVGSNAKFEIIEYGDFECSYCGQAYPVVKELQKVLGDKMTFVFRNFPLYEIHPYAVNAAIAAEVAAKMGKYWEMHDLLYENQHHLDIHHLETYAKKIGLDAQQFKNELTQIDKYMPRIDADLESGLRSGVNGTPTFFINGQRYDGNPYSVEAFLEYLEQ